MKFLADMGVSPRCVEWLRMQSYDAVHLYEQSLHKLPDSEVFSRILSSIEADNLPLTVIFRLSDERPQNVKAVIELILPMPINTDKYKIGTTQ